MDPAAGADCVFCKIVAKQIPAEVVHETDTTVAFRDLAPEAPVHVLVIPRMHLPNLAEVAAHEPGTLVDMVQAAAAVAEEAGLSGGYRLVANTGRDAHQTVFHAHLHVLGGRVMTWPPG
ncbi:MAG: HIT domain-containing protein [Nocardioidaceae bacterium]